MSILFAVVIFAFLSPAVLAIQFLKNDNNNKKTQVTLLREMSNCDNSLSLIAYCENLKLDALGKGKVVLNGNVILTQNLPIKEAEITLWRCKSYSEPETCEFFTKITVDDPCGNLQRKDQPWSKPLSQIKPILRCPLKKGTYQIVNVEVDTIALKKFFPGLDGYYFKVNMIGIGTNDQNIFCLNGGAEIIAMKN